MSRVERSRRERLVGGPHRLHAGDRQRTHGGPVVGEISRDDLVPLRLPDRLEVLLRELPRGLHRFAAAGREEDAIQVARGQLGQLRRQLDGTGMGVGPEREVVQLGHLLVGSVRELLATVPHVAEEEARQTVEVAPAVRIEDVAALAAHDHRHLGARAQLREVHPEVLARQLLELTGRSRCFVMALLSGNGGSSGVCQYMLPFWRDWQASRHGRSQSLPTIEFEISAACRAPARAC